MSRRRCHMLESFCDHVFKDRYPIGEPLGQIMILAGPADIGGLYRAVLRFDLLIPATRTPANPSFTRRATSRRMPAGPIRR